MKDAQGDPRRHPDAFARAFRKLVRSRAVEVDLFTQKATAEAVGLNRDTLGRLGAGTPLWVIYALAEGLDCEPSQFLPRRDGADRADGGLAGNGKPIDVAEADTHSLQRLRREVRDELDQRAGRPTEKAVRGDLLAAFDADWPDGWSWAHHGESLWGAGPTDEYPEEPPPPDPELFYDLKDWCVEHATQGGKSLWELFHAWYSQRDALTNGEPSRETR